MLKRFLIALTMTVATVAVAAPLRPATNRGAAAPRSDGQTGAEVGGRNIEFNNAPLDMVFKVYGELLDKTILRDPGIPSPTITLQPRKGQQLTDEDKIEALETVLEMNGIHMEPYMDKFVRAVPRKEVRKEGIPLIMDSEAVLRESTRVVSLMLPFKNISVEDAQKALDNFKSATGIIIGFERTNSLLLTDTEANVNRMREIARAIDIATPVLEDVFIRQIKNASAEEIKTALETIVQESQKELEKEGKGVQNAQPQNRLQTPRLLRPNANQPATPANNESLVMAVSDADRGMIRGKVLILADERSNKLVIITMKSNMDFFDKVIAELDVETTPDVQVKVYRLKYADAEDVSDMINDLIGNSASSKNTGGRGNQNQNSKAGGNSNITRGNSQRSQASANQRTGESKAGELNKDNVTVLADKRINGLVVMARTEDIPTLESIIESMDIKLSQVLIETVIIEVGLGDGIETGMDWVQKGRKKGTKQATDSMGQKLFYKKQVTTTTGPNGTSSSTTVLPDLVPAGFENSSSSTRKDGDDNTWTTTITESASDVAGSVAEVVRSGLMNNYGGATSVGLAGGANNGQAAFDFATGSASNLLGKAFNFVFDSDELGLSAILQASKTDSRTKYIASPIIMTLDNKEATIEATQMRYLFKGYQYSGSSMYGSAVPDYEQKELGITIKTTPKINPNGTVMLTLEEEYSQMGGTQAITGQDGRDINAENTVTRKMSADALLENGQTVIFAGLTQTSVSESESGIPFLKDIPFIGKWLFGSVKNSEDRSELLVFMTPYVLDDADAAQAEAIRRKKTMSDANPWDDHGWSLSKLADPVSKREQMRRLKDEWKKQDAERDARLEIEKSKVERAQKLREMSLEERKLWLKLHEKELREEEREELERKMLDKDSQEELKKLAERIRAEKLADADEAIDANTAALHAENERGKLDAEKAKAETKEANADEQ